MYESLFWFLQMPINFSMSAQRFDSNIFDDPAEFRPERWLRESREDIHKYAMPVFGLGPRSCIGMFA